MKQGGTALAVLLAFLPRNAPAQDYPPSWSSPTPPLRIAHNVYYVGTEGLSAYLITSDEGHILIDVGLPGNAGFVASNITALGFHLKDVRYLLINHAHFDHSGGLAAMKRMTGAQLWSSEGDRGALEAGATPGRLELPGFPPVKVDHVVADGETLRLGDAALAAMVTPGHTKGCTSWRMQAGSHKIIFACSLTVAGQNLVTDPCYPNAAEDFSNSFARMRALQADIYVNFHTDQFDFAAKRARLLAGDVEAFVNPSELAQRIKTLELGFERERARQIKEAAVE